jgi:hypothetical protein
MLKQTLSGASKTKTTALLVSLLYLLLIVFLEGLKAESVVIVVAFNACIWLSRGSRNFIVGFSIFIVFAILYDLMKLYPNYKVNPVDIAGLYHFEKSTFGFYSQGILVTPNEFFAQHHNAFLDFLGGIFYLNWIPLPIAFAGWLYFNNKKQFLQFSLTFLLVNLIGFCIYYIHPAAPPWYVAKYGFDFHQNTGGNTAGLGRFDAMVHVKLFGSLYSRNSNVFAAMPSLHCAYPLIVFYYSFKSHVKNMKWLFGIIMIGIWFTAVYSGHHYVTDDIMGIICAFTGIFIFQSILLKMSFFNTFLSKYEQAIS